MQIQGIEQLVETVSTEEIQVSPQQFEVSLKSAMADQPKSQLAKATNQPELLVLEALPASQTEGIEAVSIGTQPVSEKDLEERREPEQQEVVPPIMQNLAIRLPQTGMPLTSSVSASAPILVAENTVPVEYFSTAQIEGSTVIEERQASSPEMAGLAATASPMRLAEHSLEVPVKGVGIQPTINEQPITNLTEFGTQRSEQVAVRESQSGHPLSKQPESLNPQIDFVVEEVINQSRDLPKDTPQPVLENQADDQQLPGLTINKPLIKVEMTADDSFETAEQKSLEPQLTTKIVDNPTAEFVPSKGELTQTVIPQQGFVKETKQQTVTQTPVSPASPETVRSFQQQNLARITELLTQPTLKEGQEVMKLTLQPEKLGQLDVLVKLEEGKISAKFLVGNETVKELVEKSLPLLEQNLIKQQISVGKVDVSLQTAQGSFDFNGQFEQQQHTHQPRGKTVRRSSHYQEQKQVEIVEVADRVDILV